MKICIFLTDSLCVAWSEVKPTHKLSGTKVIKKIDGNFKYRYAALITPLCNTGGIVSELQKP